MWRTEYASLVLLLPYGASGEFRNFDGTGNNLGDPSRGAAGSPFIRLHEPAYVDGVSEPPRQNGPSAREVMRELFLEVPVKKESGTSQFMPTFGQLVAHDISGITYNDSTAESFPILCADNVADMFCPVPGTSTIDFQRTEWTMVNGVRHALNMQTSYLDGSVFYGVNEEQSGTLRTFEGGRMNLTEDGNLHLIDTKGGSHGAQWLIADERNTNNLSLQSLLTLFLREHNRRAGDLSLKYPGMEEEELYQRSRQWVVALLQAIFESEYAPRVLGEPLGERVYNEAVDPSTETFFAGVAFRYGHSSVSSVNRILDENFLPMQLDPIPLRLSMFNTAPTVLEVGIEPVLRGLSLEADHAVGGAVVDDMLLFKASIPTFNVQRGRDMGICSFNDCRAPLGLEPLSSLEDITDDPNTLDILQRLYGGLDDIDPYVGALVEAHPEGSSMLVPSLMRASLKEQYERLRNGDRLWHNRLDEFEAVGDWSLSRLVTENCRGMELFPLDAFSTLTYSVCEGGSCAQDGSRLFELDDNYLLEWSIFDENKLSFKVTVSKEITTGFIGLGIGSLDMEDADVVFCEFANSVADCVDSYSTQNRRPDSDVDEGGVNDVTEVSVVVEEGQTSVSFVRPFDAMDDKDLPILRDDVTKVIAAYNPDVVAFHGMGRIAKVTINFSTGESTGESFESTSSFFAFHGAVMLLAWLVVAPFGIFVNRYMKGFPLWLELHEGSLGFVAEAVIPVAASALATTKGNFRTTHALLGTLVMVYIVFQLISGFQRAYSLKTSEYSRWAKITAMIHTWGGRGIFIVAIATCYHGLNIIAPDATFQLVSVEVGTQQVGLEIQGFKYFVRYFWPYIGILIVFFAVCEVRRFFQHKGAKLEFHKKGDLPVFSLTEFNEQIHNGAKWVMVDDAVVDLDQNSFLEIHPGGARVLRGSIGTDIKKELAGEATADVGHSHRHSAQAINIVAKMVIGYVSGGRAEVEGTAGNPLTEKMKFQKYSLVESHQVSENDDRPVFLFTFAARKGEKQPQGLKAGQYLRFQAPLPDGTVVQRSYTPVDIVNHGQVKAYRFAIRLYPNGLMSSILKDLKNSSNMRMIGPLSLGRVTFPPFDDYIYMFAGGTGISPMMQVIREYLRAAGLEEMDSQAKEYDQQEVHGQQKSGRSAPIKPGIAADRSANKKSRDFQPGTDGPWPPRGTGDGKLFLAWQAKNNGDLYLLDQLETWREKSGGRFSYMLLIQHKIAKERETSMKSMKGLFRSGRRLARSKSTKGEVSSRKSEERPGNNRDSRSTEEETKEKQDDTEEQVATALVTGDVEGAAKTEDVLQIGRIDKQRILVWLQPLLESVNFQNNLPKTVPKTPSKRNIEHNTSRSRLHSALKKAKLSHMKGAFETPERRDNHDENGLDRATVSSVNKPHESKEENAPFGDARSPRFGQMDTGVSAKGVEMDCGESLPRTEKVGSTSGKHRVFICGRAGFTEKIESILEEIGVPKACVSCLD
ncbi:unnamed protein product [Discosporangium mesarthrocarpum]